MIFTRALLALVLCLGFSTTAFAHSTVAPSQVATSKYETFTLSVPTEREVPTTAVTLLVPESLERVTPFVKPGWRITVITSEEDKVTEIRWTGGSIPAGQKDVFEFTARTPAEDAELVWKTYQTYLGGEVVAWDQDPTAHEEHEGEEEEVSNPYSITEVKADAGAPEGMDTSLILSILSIILAAGALWMASKRTTA